MLDGYLIALANMDDFIRIIREIGQPRRGARQAARLSSGASAQIAASASRSAHRGRFVNGRYALSERQANAILDLRLYQLTGLERDKITGEYAELMVTITRPDGHPGAANPAC